MEDRPSMAALLMMSGLFLLSLQDSLVKLMSAEVSLWQFQLLRAGINLLLLFCLAYFLWRRKRPAIHRLWAIVLRGFLLAGTMVLFFGGIPFLSLAEIAAGLYVFPLFLILLSRAVLGERVGLQRIVAIVMGFTGTLFILKIGTESFSLVALMPVLAAMSYAGTILVTRKLCRYESPVALAFGVSFAFLVVGSLGLLVFSGDFLVKEAHTWPYLFTGWKTINLTILGIIIVCSLLNLVANISLSKAYQSAESTWLAPFDYSYLVFASFWGAVMWHDIPDGFSILGIVMIAASGMFVAWRERKEQLESAAATVP